MPTVRSLRRGRDGPRRNSQGFDFAGSQYVARQATGMSQAEGPESPILLPKGFSFSTANAGIKASGRPDLAFVKYARPTLTGAPGLDACKRICDEVGKLLHVRGEQ